MTQEKVQCPECSHSGIIHHRAINTEWGSEKYVTIMWQDRCKLCGAWIGEPYNKKYKVIK